VGERTVVATTAATNARTITRRKMMSRSAPQLDTTMAGREIAGCDVTVSHPDGWSVHRYVSRIDNMAGRKVAVLLDDV
jgi:hypothetical protein